MQPERFRVYAAGCATAGSPEKRTIESTEEKREHRAVVALKVTGALENGAIDGEGLAGVGWTTQLARAGVLARDIGLRLATAVGASYNQQHMCLATVRATKGRHD